MFWVKETAVNGPSVIQWGGVERKTSHSPEITSLSFGELKPLDCEQLFLGVFSPLRWDRMATLG